MLDSTCIERFCVHSGHTKQATMMYPSLIGHSSLMKGCVCIWRSYTWRSAKLLKLVQYTNLSVVTLCVKYFSPMKAIACLEDLQTLTQDLCVSFYWKASSVYARIHASKTSTNLFCICFHTSRRPSSSIQRLPVRVLTAANSEPVCTCGLTHACGLQWTRLCVGRTSKCWAISQSCFVAQLKATASDKGCG
jgi:hypothetical protein